MQTTSENWKITGGTKEGKERKKNKEKEKKERKCSMNKGLGKDNGKTKKDILKGKERKKNDKKLSLRIFVRNLRRTLKDLTKRLKPWMKI